jgi:hypothetical protein
MTKKKPCPDCQNTRVRSVTTTYDPVTGQVIRKTKNPCRSCS